jgi:hypothetical protein
MLRDYIRKNGVMVETSGDIHKTRPSTETREKSRLRYNEDLYYNFWEKSF